MGKRDPVIVSAVRTAVGTLGGSLKGASHEQLATTVMDAVCRRANFPKNQLDDIYWGVVMPRSDENGLARGAALKAGIPEHVSAVQVNTACFSSMEAVRIASMAIRLGEADAVLAGGGESMSNVPFSIKNARWGLRLGHQELSDGLWDGLTDHHTGLIMGMTAENVAEKYNSLGHPIWNTGCRILLTLIHEMEKHHLKRGLAALCGGGGHGAATIIEATD